MNTAVLQQESYPIALAVQPMLQINGCAVFRAQPQMGMARCSEQAVRREDEGAAPAQKAALAPWLERKAKQILASCFEEKLSIAQVASRCSLSRSHFSRAFKKATGMSPQEWMHKSRIERAQHLITERSLSMCEVAFECGFADQAHFTRAFRKHAGLSPKQWQRSQCSHVDVL
ncbi:MULTISPECIES: AraC family transcriptional regulator [unclassified Pseudomonas]|uniref:helix-turn-helix domain-containing protein n=1 Tax=unclassified Pseudomonas TaxID=196821 RepID=UPI000D39E022|nr:MULTISPECIES: AraC family transcriptional regulator [unclassified Pseudomonas]RAU47919.1 AraC family transcriptional regulator [Pseudomonas sp. RIT 409]RAU55387.1 AraC family transcriptional regulator [Pseudomonas sp. RIT 412]